MTTLPLSESGSVTLDPAGGGKVAIGPQSPRVAWQVSGVATSGDSSSEPTLKLYYARESPSALLGGTYTANLDSDMVSVVIHSGQQIIGVYSGGSANAVMTLTVHGTRTVP